MGKQSSISVVIPNYCGQSLLEKYLPYLLSALNSSKQVSSYEVIIVDDASLDNSVTFLETFYPNILLLQNEKNVGFSQTINKGIFAATKNFIFVLNNDMLVTEGLFDTLLIPFSTKENVFGVFPMIKDMEGTKILEAQKLPKETCCKIHYKDNKEQKELSYSFYLCGGAALIDREKLILLGGFSTIYSPFYFEDFDLSLRAWKNDWKSYYDPDVFCYHCHSATVNGLDKKYVREIYIRNSLIFNYLFLEEYKVMLFFVSICVKCIVRTHHRKTFLRAVSSAFLMRNILRKMKLDDRKKNVLSLREVVEKYFSLNKNSLH